MDPASLDRLLEQNLAFLREYCHLSGGGRVEFSREAHIPEQVFSNLVRHPWYRSDPAHYQPAVDYDAVERDYKRMQADLPVMNSKRDDNLYRMIGDSIGDSEEFVMIDIGSATGKFYTRPIARRKKNARFFMVDRSRRADISDFDLATPTDPKYAYREGFKNLTPFRGDVEKWMNELLAANDYTNVTYLHRELTRSLDGDELPELKRFTRNRRAVFTGLKNPAGLSYATIREAGIHGAARIYTTPTSTENILDSSPAWATFRRLLSSHLAGRELENYYSLLHAETELPSRYDYCKPEEQRMAIALKQLFALSLAHAMLRLGYEPDIFIDDDNRAKSGYDWGYNQADHVVVGSKN